MSVLIVKSSRDRRLLRLRLSASLVFQPFDLNSVKLYMWGLQFKLCTITFKAVNGFYFCPPRAYEYVNRCDRHSTAGVLTDKGCFAYLLKIQLFIKKIGCL